MNRRALNRALLARQLLLERVDLPVTAAIEQVAGLQSQEPLPPFGALWNRLAGFDPAQLEAALAGRHVIRTVMMRSTLHLVSTADFLRLRTALQPALDRALRAFYGKRGRDLPIGKLVAAARPFLAAEPRTTGDLRDFLLTIEPDRAADAMAYAVRNALPLVHVPPITEGGAPRYTLAADWTGAEPDPADGIRELLRRYLAAFGPASAMDFQAWTGLVRQQKAVKALEAEFAVFEAEETGERLLDLPDAPRPPAETPAPVRLLDRFDAALIAHRDRSRILPDAVYPRVFRSAGRVLPTLLIDGFAAGVWQIMDEALTVEVYTDLTAGQREAVAAEGERLLAWQGIAAGTVRFGQTGHAP